MRFDARLYDSSSCMDSQMKRSLESVRFDSDPSLDVCRRVTTESHVSDKGSLHMFDARKILTYNEWLFLSPENTGLDRGLILLWTIASISLGDCRKLSLEQIRDQFLDPAIKEKLLSITLLNADFILRTFGRNVEIPREIKYFKNLKILKLTDLNITKLPDGIGELTELDEMYLSGNSLNTLPDSFINLQSLKGIDISNNNFRSLPVCFGHLNKLENIVASGNKIVRLSLPFLPNLRRLILFKNRIETFAVQDERFVFENLSELELSNNRLEFFPNIFTFPNLTNLELDNNNLLGIPIRIREFSKLKKLDLSNNVLTALPGEMGELSMLEELYANGNRIADFPRSFGRLASLKTFIFDTASFPVSVLRGVRLPRCLFYLSLLKNHGNYREHILWRERNIKAERVKELILRKNKCLRESFINRHRRFFL